MEVVAGTAGGPFSRRNVQEWSRLDRLTGMLETARVETDHWANNTDTSSHHFGKVVDARSRNLADGGQEQRLQTKQLEVFQAQVPGGSLQVIRSSTTSSWQTHKTLSGSSGWAAGERSDRLALPSTNSPGFDHLKLTLNPLDLSSQKTKATVGRSGSIGSRRPPSRPRSIAGVKPKDFSEQTDGRRVTELSNETRHESSHKKLLNGFSSDQTDDSTIINSLVDITDTPNNISTKELIKSSSNSTVSRSHHNLIRKKSCSSEDLHVVDEEGEVDSNNSDWRRSSKVRRSLQFPPKPTKTLKETIVIPVTKSVSEIKKEIEARKQLLTNSFRTNQWNNFAELEGVLGVVNKDSNEDHLKDGTNSSDESNASPSKSKKRQTFITVESLKEVRGRLRKLNSPVDEVLKNDDVDDGIVTEVKTSSPLAKNSDETSKNSVKSYVFGMEVMLRKTKPPGIGTGSLESRGSNKSLTNGANRSEEWYNRRKSYGFEQVGNQQNDCTSFEKSKIESSTDSGICRSSDTFPSWSKLADKSSNNISPIKTTHSIMIKSYLDADIRKPTDIEGDTIIQKGKKTVVNLMNNNTNSSWTWNSKDGEITSEHADDKQGVSKSKIADTIKSLREKTAVENHRLSEPITITIPIQQTTRTKHTDPADLLLKQTKSLGVIDKAEETTNISSNGITPYSELLFGKDNSELSKAEPKSMFENIPWRGSRTKALSNFFDSEFKRHSIAVDQTKYLSGKPSFRSYYINGSFETSNNEIENHHPNNSVVLFNHNEIENNNGIVDSDHELNNEKRHKKVEFCKTEVHFAAEPGRFNIVETDGKPPPSNMYRRRRKTVSDAPTRSGLPEIRFGDTQYEKSLLTTAESIPPEDISTPKSLVFRGSPVIQDERLHNETIINHSNDTYLHTKMPDKSSPQLIDYNKYLIEPSNSAEDDTPKPRSILKNNIPKPKPYLLGETPETNFSDEATSWGVKLKSVKSDDESPKWQNESKLPKETEFQKLLKSLKPAASKPTDLFECLNQSELSAMAADNGLEVRISSASTVADNRRASWSVAERVKHEEAKGYSTKVNFGPKETTVVDVDQQYQSPDGFRSTLLIKDQSSSYDGTSRISPSFTSIPDHQVTSISLGYEEPPPTTSTSRTQLDNKHLSKSFVSRSLLNTNSSEIASRVELSSSGDRTWSFSKTLNKDNTLSRTNNNGLTSQKSLFPVDAPDKLTAREVPASPGRFSRSSQSPCKESLFLERTAERNIMYNENNRQASASPTSGTSNRSSSLSLSTIKLDSYHNSTRRNDKTSYHAKPLANHTKISSQSNSNVLKSKAEDKVDFVKKSDIKKPMNEVKPKERKLSTSSSGRDGWLNTPKEVQVRKKPEPSVRKPEPKKDNKTFERMSKANNVRTSQKRTESPIYQNREIYAEKAESNDNTETESTILEELTKAADQILLAVNGYTDDDSFRASSEDEFRKKKERTLSQPLCTISEMPTKKTNINKTSSRQVIKSTRSTDLRKELRSSSKTRAGKTSSNSSMEGSTTLPDVKPLLSPEDRSKRRAARLLQRASSRELLLQAAASSSEDIGSGSDTGSLRTKRVFRRSRHSGSKQDLTARSVDSRPKERAQQSISTSETIKSQRTKAMTDSRCSRHTKSSTGGATNERHDRDRRSAAVTHITRTQKKKLGTSH